MRNYIPLFNMDVIIYRCPKLDACSSSYRQVSNISRTLGNKIVDHSDVIGASPVGAAPTTSSFSTLTLGFYRLGKDNYKTNRESFKFWDLVRFISEMYVRLSTIRAWISNRTNGFIWDVINHICFDLNDGLVIPPIWMRNFIPLFYIDVIIHLCP